MPGPVWTRPVWTEGTCWLRRRACRVVPCRVLLCQNYEYCWVVDPIDGTKEFIKRNGEFTVMIGLVQVCVSVCRGGPGRCMTKMNNDKWVQVSIPPLGPGVVDPIDTCVCVLGGGGLGRYICTDRHAAWACQG